MKKLLLLSFLTLILFSSGATSQAVDPDISVKAEVDRAVITIGDNVTYKITIRHKKDIQILSSLPAPASDVFKIKKASDFKKEEKNFISEGRQFIVTSFRLGEFILEPVKIQYKLPKSDKPQTIETNKIYITVQSISGTETKKDIKGIKSVVALALKILKPLLIVILGSLLIFIAIWIYQRRKKAAEMLNSFVPQLTAEEEAIARLNKLFDSDLLKKDRYKDYYLELTDILSHYFEKRFRIEALESTTYEIIQKLQKKEISPELIRKIDEVLNAADLAKFAKWKPTPQEVLAINKKSKNIIEESTLPSSPALSPQAEEKHAL